jgi:hypothetical protein
LLFRLYAAGMPAALQPPDDIVQNYVLPLISVTPKPEGAEIDSL